MRYGHRAELPRAAETGRWHTKCTGLLRPMLNERMPTMQDSVEFIGGPYDGYRHKLNCMPAGIFEKAALPVSENLIRAVTGEDHGPLLPCHRVAVYRLEQAEEEEWKYHFLGEMVTESAGGTLQ